MILRLLSCLLLATVASGAPKEISYDGERIILPEAPGMEEIGAETDYYKEKAKAHASSSPLVAAFHGHDDGGCLQVLVLSSQDLGYGPVTTPDAFRPRAYGFGNMSLVHNAERCRIYRANEKRDLFGLIQCQGKVLMCMMFRHRLDDGVPRELQVTSVEDERRFLEWAKAVVAANPPLTPKQIQAQEKDRWIKVFAYAAAFAMIIAIYSLRGRWQPVTVRSKKSGEV